MELEYDDAWAAAAEARPLSLSLPLTLGRALHKGAAGWRITGWSWAAP
jgi:HipA-like protein